MIPEPPKPAKAPVRWVNSRACSQILIGGRQDKNMSYFWQREWQMLHCNKRFHSRCVWLIYAWSLKVQLQVSDEWYLLSANRQCTARVTPVVASKSLNHRGIPRPPEIDPQFKDYQASIINVSISGSTSRARAWSVWPAKAKVKSEFLIAA